MEQPPSESLAHPLVEEAEGDAAGTSRFQQLHGITLAWAAPVYGTVGLNLLFYSCTLLFYCLTLGSRLTIIDEWDYSDASFGLVCNLAVIVLLFAAWRSDHANQGIGVEQGVEQGIEQGSRATRLLKVARLLWKVFQWCRKRFNHLVYISPVSLALPVYFLIRSIAYPSVPLIREPSVWMNWLFLIGSVALLISLTALVRPSVAEPIVLCGGILQDFIGSVEVDHSVNWNDKVEEVQRISRHFQQIWDFSGPGVVILVSIGLASITGVIGASLCLCWLLQPSERNQLYISFGSILFFGGTFLGLLFLLLLASVTKMCVDKRDQGNSILAAALRYPSRRVRTGNPMKESEWLAYHWFISYVERNFPGVQIFGIVVSNGLVVSLSIKLLLAAPIAFIFLARIMQPMNKFASMTR